MFQPWLSLKEASDIGNDLFSMCETSVPMMSLGVSTPHYMDDPPGTEVLPLQSSLPKDSSLTTWASHRINAQQIFLPVLSGFELIFTHWTIIGYTQDNTEVPSSVTSVANSVECLILNDQPAIRELFRELFRELPSCLSTSHSPMLPTWEVSLKNADSWDAFWLVLNLFLSARNESGASLIHLKNRPHLGPSC